MSTINRAPTGWLGFLGIKNFGRNPETAGTQLVPTWDLQKFYLSANRRYVNATFTITGLGFFGVGQVQPGEVWYVDGYCGLTNNLAAGNALDFSIAYQNAIGNVVVIGSTGPRIAPAVGGRGAAAISEPLILQPSERLGLYVVNHAGANIGGEVNYSYVRMDM